MSLGSAHNIPDLLHDACLLSGTYNGEDGEDGELRLTYECLRRHTDGSAMKDRNVTLHLQGVTAVTAAYDTFEPEGRPSEFLLPEEARIATLTPWPLPAMEVELSVNSPASAESLALAAHRQSLMNANGEEAEHLVCLHLTLGTPPVQVLLAVRCASVRPYASGQPLALDIWAEEFAAWWRGWEEHWRSHDGRETVAEEAFIPAAGGDSCDRSYSPPSQPAFECPVADAPNELLSPIREWFEAGFALDAARRIGVAPNLDDKIEDQVALELEAMTGHEYGSWDYAREVEGWWIEGGRAYVGVAGVTHYMPMDGDPAENHLSRWSFELRRRGGVWQIHQHTSAVDDELGSRPWAQRWRVI